jgi:signal transduction histidine kinase
MALDAGENEEQKRSDINEIGNIAKRSVDTIRDLVWLMNRDSEKLEEFVNEMHVTALSLLRGVNWRINVDPHLHAKVLSFEVRRHLFLAFKELIHNAAKHAFAHKIEIQLKEDSGQLELSVSDNGIGFEMEKVVSGIGLQSLKTRAENLRGNLDVFSQKERGTVVKLKFPMHR